MLKRIFAFALLSIIIISSSDIYSQDFINNEYDLEYRKWRVTLFPPLSSNGADALNYTAKYSINLLWGVHGGLDGAEIGGLVNYEKYYAHGFQLAGLVNASGGEMMGVNIAGLLNYSDDEMTGIQLAGIGNYTNDELTGIQAAGIFNYSTRSTSGIQFAGIGNISNSDIDGLQGSGIFNYSNDDLSGLQVSGITNISRYDVEGLQVAGILNSAGGDISGLQVSGFGNIALEDMEGLQVSSAFNFARKNASGLLVSGGLNVARNLEGAVFSAGANIARELNGLQFAGLLNVAENATGLQIGLINLAKEFDGVPVGFISYYGNGRKNFDLRYSDAGFTEIGINLGTYRVYNMAILGYNTVLDRDVYRVGIGVGLEKNIQDSFRNINSKTLFVNQEVSYTHHFEDEFSRKTNAIWSYKFMVGNRFTNGFSLYGGPSINMQVTRVPEASDYTWYSLWSPDWNGRQYRFWVGFNIGLRLFKQKNLPPFSEVTNSWENGNTNWVIPWD